MKLGTFQLVIVFTLAAQLAALLFTYVMVPLQGVVSFAPVSGEAGPVANALIILIFPIVGSLLLLKFHRKRAFTYFYAAGEALLVAFLTFFIFLLLNLDWNLSSVAAGAIAVAGFVALLRGGAREKAAFSLILSSEAGAYFAIAFPPPTIYLILLFFALYDYYSVSRGPLKKVVEQVPFGALSVDFGSVSMGLGDELFYSMTPSSAFLLGGAAAAVAMLLVVDAGVIVTLMLLVKRKALPGLTIPLLLALGLFAVMTYV